MLLKLGPSKSVPLVDVVSTSATAPLTMDNHESSEAQGRAVYPAGNNNSSSTSASGPVWRPCALHRIGMDVIDRAVTRFQ